jgi:hypothetical protein
MVLVDIQRKIFLATPIRLFNRCNTYFSHGQQSIKRWFDVQELLG